MTDASPKAAPQRFLDATQQTISWFWKRAESNELELRPPFQRKPVWQTSQKAYLIDSILRGYPVPELYLQTSMSPDGDEIHTVVDGQQRIRACIEYLSGNFPLGDEAGEYAGLYFGELGPEGKQQIFQYKFLVRSLPSLSQEEIREIFGRLNRNNVALNRQELRQATYWGEFIDTMNEIAQREYWVTSGLFTSNDIRRMLDVEYVSELTIGALYGPQNKKASLDEHYASFELEFPDRGRTHLIFDRVLDELSHILDTSRRLRWSRKVDFYTLFLVMAEMVDDFPLSREEREVLAKKLQDFSDAVKKAQKPDEDSEERDTSYLGKSARQYARGIRNSSDLGSRRTRLSALRGYLWNSDGELEEESVPPAGVAETLPTMEELYAAVEEEDDGEEDEAEGE
ncbi:DUF262 domain-containing protein [Streptomyces sp. NPDC020377]|uniref:DUF262 domain-containing protein n=1 Tax=Streptomyces sp. NPDC020377 TaxID=3365070 RepID=UPI0037A9A7DA